MRQHSWGEGRERVTIKDGEHGPAWAVGDSSFADDGGAHTLESDFAEEILVLSQTIELLEARVRDLEEREMEGPS